MTNTRLPGPGSDLTAKLGQPALRAFELAGYTQLEQFRQAQAADLITMHGVGPKAIRLLREMLAEHGWSFADERSTP
jgi:hypothetical protein